jgi:hypothetical protein
MTLLTRWEPFREFSTMQDRINRMNRLFRESYSPEGPEEAFTTTFFARPVDIYVDARGFHLQSNAVLVFADLLGCCYRTRHRSSNVVLLDS